MKKNRKLNFGKMTIAKLSTSQASNIKGAGTEANCNTFEPGCDTIIKTKLGSPLCQGGNLPPTYARNCGTNP